MEKLKSKDFNYLRGHGKTFKTEHFLFVFDKLASNQTASSQEDSLIFTELHFGVTVTKKVGNAVLRNRLRRLLRESMRLNLKEKNQMFLDKMGSGKIQLNVVVLRKPDLKNLSFCDVDKEVQFFLTSRIFC